MHRRRCATRHSAGAGAVGPAAGGARGRAPAAAGSPPPAGAVRRRRLPRRSGDRHRGAAGHRRVFSRAWPAAAHPTSTMHGALPSGDGERIRLPATLDGLPPADVPRRYRLLALGAGCPRGPRHPRRACPSTTRCSGISTSSPKRRRSMRMLVRMFPRLAPGIREARREAGRATAGRCDVRRARSSPSSTWCGDLLAADPHAPPPPFVHARDTGGSRALGPATAPVARGRWPVPTAGWRRFRCGATRRAPGVVCGHRGGSDG